VFGNVGRLDGYFPTTLFVGSIQVLKGSLEALDLPCPGSQAETTRLQVWALPVDMSF